MANFADFLQDREDDRLQGQPSPTAPVSAGVAPGGSPAPGGSQPAQQPAANPAPSNFRSFADTYSANDTAAQSSASKLAAPAQQAGQAAQTGLQGLQATFGQAVTAGTPLQGPTQAVTPYQPPAAQAQTPAIDYSKPYVAPAQKAYQSTGRTPTYNDVHDMVRQNRDRLGMGDDDGATAPKSKSAAAAAPATPAPASPGIATARSQSGVYRSAEPPLAGSSYAYANPGAISADEARRRAGLSYTGPAGITDDPRFAQVAKQTADAQARAQALGTTGGRQALLQQQNAGRGYGQGASNLDAMLTGQAAGDFQGLRRTFGDMGATLNKAVGDSQALATGARNSVADKAKLYGDEAAAYDKSIPVAPPPPAAAPTYQVSVPDPVYQANHPDENPNVDTGPIKAGHALTGALGALAGPVGGFLSAWLNSDPRFN